MPSKRREAIIERLGVTPPVATLVRSALDEAITDAEVRVDGRAAGHGPRRRLRARLAAPRRSDRGSGGWSGPTSTRLVEPLPHLDEFAVVDLCGPSDAFAPGTFDLVLSSFTLEHLAEPVRRSRTCARGSPRAASSSPRPSTAATRSSPPTSACRRGIRRRLQPLVKSTAADAHPLVGACNDRSPIARCARRGRFPGRPDDDRRALARAWGRTWPTFALGLAGDLIAQRAPTRRSTIVAVARA